MQGIYMTGIYLYTVESERPPILPGDRWSKMAAHMFFKIWQTPLIFTKINQKPVFCHYFPAHFMQFRLSVHKKNGNGDQKFPV